MIYTSSWVAAGLMISTRFAEGRQGQQSGMHDAVWVQYWIQVLGVFPEIVFMFPSYFSCLMSCPLYTTPMPMVLSYPLSHALHCVP